ncbi:butyrophilin subfamily 1 member A1-like [Salminus brasiliensis]|uniref:butyrophilin subfamily 1 member A1-like n=1 Tax=Salminus brasiliensis TaxID=930266 RepID=UPI003B838401
MLVLLMIFDLLGGSSGAVGSHPVLSLAEAGDQVNVTCESDGWSPKPTVTWRDKGGGELRNSSESYNGDSKGLVSVTSWVLLYPSESEWISCSVSLSARDLKEGRVLPFSPALAETADKATNTEEEIPDWGKMLACKVAIRPDASTTGFLEVGKSQTRVTCKSITNEAELVHVLGKERIRSGRYYWEITALTEPPPAPKIGKSYECPSSWYVGVTSEAAEKKSRVPLTPQYSYWVLHYDKERGYYVNDPSLTNVLVRDRFSKLGVFLDCVKNKLSFYDCDKKSHLYTFYNVDSTKPLVPVLSPGEKLQHTLVICEEQCVTCDELYA